MRILSRSSRKCIVTGIDSHELQGLDVVQCAALVETYHGIVNLTMAMFRKLSTRTSPNLLANQLLSQPHLMLIFSTTLPLVHPSLHASISVTRLQLIGIPRSKQQWRQLHMVLSSSQPRQQLNRLWT